MVRLYCICAAVVALVGPAEAGRYAQGAAVQPAGAPRSTGYTVFLRGAPLGREDVTVRQTPDAIVVTSQGRLGAPYNSVTRQAEFRYAPDWTAQSFTFDGTINGGPVSVQTAFSGGTATTTGTQAGTPVSVSHMVSPQTIILPNGAFSAYAALALRLAAMRSGDELRAYVLPQVEIPVRIDGVVSEQMQLGNSIIEVRRYELAFANPGGELKATLTADSDGTLIRLNIAAQALDVVRDDVAASTSRTQVFSNPGDEPVTIPVTGFNLGATLTRPKTGAPRVPAVVLLSGSGVGDRDGFALGIPTLGQLAGAIADAGFMAVRYDKRGFGQSGGRAESATISDYAEDARAVVRWLAKRKDVDPRRIAVVGHSEGAWVALLAASREKRIAAVVSIAGAGVTGVEFNLEQQRMALDQSQLTAEDREKRIALQKQIQSAVLTGKGWEGVPPELRKQADLPWFQSFLAYDPAKVLEDVDQPLLFVHGALDRQVPVEHVERLANLARTESDSKSVEVVVVRGVNHLMVPAITGEIAEYGTLTDRSVSMDVASAVTMWLSRTFAAIR